MLLACTAAVVCPGGLASGQSPSRLPATAADIGAGRQIFAAQCALCHGADGSGGTGPSLRVRVLRHAADEAALLDVIRDGIPGTAMPSFVWALSERSLRQTAAYVRSLGKADGGRIPGDPARGRALYQGSECVTCHTIRGTGGGLGPDLSTIGASRGASSLRQSLVDPGAEHAPGYLVASVTAAGAAPVRGIVLDEDVFWIHLRDVSGRVRSWQKTDAVRVERESQGSLMPSYRSRFSDAQLDDLVAYLSSLQGGR